MNKGIILIGEGADARAALAASEARAADSGRQWVAARAGALALADLARQGADVVLAVTADPDEVSELYGLKAKTVWDMSLLTAQAVDDLLASDDGAARLKRAIACAQAYVGVTRDVADRIEDAFAVGLSRHAIGPALRAMANQTAVVLGAGLGNMVYGASMVRWVSEQIGAPVDLIIHDRFDFGVPLFANAPWLNAVYPGYEFAVGRHYSTIVNSITAGALRPPFTADRSYSLNRDYSYNEEGRFIHETRVNFLGLNGAFGDGPTIPTQPPYPFIRDGGYRPGGGKVVGVANGAKPGAWAKREWPFMPQLVERLKAEGYTVRSFGIPIEYVEGAEDFTGIPMRRVVQEMAACDFFVSYDGGLCHIAEGIGVPTLWLFGSTGTVKNGPVYAHGRALTSQRECGPCLYKIDWLRNHDPVCMTDISVDEVVRNLDEMAADIAANGYAPRPFALDGDLQVYEIEALDRPAPVNERARYAAERTSVYPAMPIFYRRLGVSLMMAGDIAGAASLVAAGLARWADDLPLRFLMAAIDAVHRAPTPFDTLADGRRPRASAPAAIDPAALIAGLWESGFDVRERRWLIDAGLRYFQRIHGRTEGLAWARAVLDNGPFSAGLTKFAERHIDRLMRTGDAAPTRSGGLGIMLEANNATLRMNEVLRQGARAALEAESARLAEVLPHEPEDILSAGLTPYLVAVDPCRHRPMELALGARSLTVPAFGTVVVIVPHIRYKDALPGTASNLLLRQFAGLTAIGLRLHVVSVGFDDVPEAVTFRDSVSYIQGHPRWPAQEWSDLVSTLKPDVCLSYGGIDADLDLPAEVADGLIRISLDGLLDIDGLVNSFNPDNRWDSGSDAWPADRPADARADDVTGWLAQELPALEPTRPGALQALVLVNDAADFARLNQLICATPDIDYRVYSAFIGRGIEKNVEWRPLEAFHQEARQGAHVLVQFAGRSVNLTGEALAWLEAGNMLVAPTPLADLPVYAQAVQSVARPDRVDSWAEALHTAELRLIAIRRGGLADLADLAIAI